MYKVAMGYNTKVAGPKVRALETSAEHHYGWFHHGSMHWHGCTVRATTSLVHRFGTKGPRAA
jgi:hypothetical protein